MSTGVLGTARGQAADAQSGMAQASRLATSEALQRARAREQVSAAKFDAGVGLALAGAEAYNKKQGIFGEGAMFGEGGIFGRKVEPTDQKV